jgi:hypothetical protein
VSLLNEVYNLKEEPEIKMFSKPVLRKMFGNLQPPCYVLPTCISRKESVKIVSYDIILFTAT